MNMTLNQKLACSAFILSAMAMLASVNDFGRYLPEHEITVLELARSIINRDELLVIDVRDKDSYQEFHIPTASNIPVSELPHSDIPTLDPIVVYSGDDSLAYQAYSIISGKRMTGVVVLRGGVHDWYERILYPKIPYELAEQNRELANEIREISEFFGGRTERTSETKYLEYYHNSEIEKAPKKRDAPLIRMGC